MRGGKNKIGQTDFYSNRFFSIIELFSSHFWQWAKVLYQILSSHNGIVEDSSLWLSHGIELWTIVDVSNENIVSIFRVQSKKSGLFVTEYEDITVPRNTGNCLPVDEACLQLKCCTHQITTVGEARSYWSSVSSFQCFSPEPITSCIPTTTVVILLLALASRAKSV